MSVDKSLRNRGRPERRLHMYGMFSLGISNTTGEVDQGLCRSETEGKRYFFDDLGLLLGT